MQEKVLAEARILKNLSHPNIIKFHDIFENDRELCLVMELVEGGELFDYLVEHGPFNEPDARCIMQQLLEALQYLHSRNIVHRDLKPENILLDRSCSTAAGPSGSQAPPTVKIADFGLAKLVGEKKVTSTFCGTPQYFAPEVLESRESHRGYDSACDLWSVGVIMYILLCGSPPFDESRPSHIASAPTRSIFEQIKAGISVQEHLTGDVWEGVSPAAKHLVGKLLMVSPVRRISVEAALRHNWMRGIEDVPGSPTTTFGTHRRPSSAAPAPPADDISDFSDDEDESPNRRRTAHAMGNSSAAGASGKRQRTAGFGPPSQQGMSARPQLQQLQELPQQRPPLQPAFQPACSQGSSAPPRQAPLAPPPASQPQLKPPPASQPQFKQPHPKPARVQKPQPNGGRVGALSGMLQLPSAMPRR